MGSPAYSYAVKQQVLSAAGVSNNFGAEYLFNIAFVNLGGGIATLTLTNEQGQSRSYSINSQQPLEIKSAPVRTFAVTGNGVTVAGVFSWPEEIKGTSLLAQVSTFQNSANLGLAQTTIFACPTNQVGQILSLTITVGNTLTTSVTVTVTIWIFRNSIADDYITPISGQPITAIPLAITPYYIGQGPNNQTVIGTVQLYGGDVLVGKATQALGVAVNYDIANIT